MRCTVIRVEKENGAVRAIEKSGYEVFFFFL